MATKKKKPQPKLDATVKMLSERTSVADTVPEFKKDWKEFRRIVEEDMLVTVQKRILIQEENRFGLREITGMVYEVGTNSCYIVDEDGVKEAMPWWSIHDWEIHVEEVEI